MEASGIEIVGQKTAMANDDRELARAAANGSRAAFDAIAARHTPALFRVALSVCGSRPDAEDICQETLIAAYSGLRRFDGRAALKTWLMAILFRQAARVMRSRARHRRNQPLDLDVPATERHGNRSDQRMDLLQAVRSLPEEFRDVVILREMEGYSYQEIAEAMAIPCGTVQSRIHRGRAILQEKLASYRPETRECQ